MQATFADSTMITALAAATNAPLLMWAIPEAPTGGRLRLNSLCGINLGGHALNLRERKYDYAYAQPEEYGRFSTKSTRSHWPDAHSVHCNRRTLAWSATPGGMDTCRLDAPTLKETFGVQSPNSTLDDLFQKMDPSRLETLQKCAAGGCRAAQHCQLEQAPLNGTLSAFAVLNQMASEHKIDGYAIRCWPEIFEQKGCSACGAMSLLNDAELPSSCEADVNGTVTQLILQAVSGSPTFDVDIVSVDGEQDQVVIWHCGKAPLSMADPTAQPEGGIHSNRKCRLVMEFPLKPGRITARE